MVQYEICFANEFAEEVIMELTKEMQLPYLREDFLTAWNERNMRSPRNLYIARKKDRLICLDCNDRDWLFTLVVICNENEAESIKRIILEWDNRSREEYGQKLTKDLKNWYGVPDSLLRIIEQEYHISLTE